MTDNEITTDNLKVNLILDAAQKRFGYYGLAKTTMTEIAQDVGLSKASLYYYFADKDALFRAVVKREQDGFVSEMEKMILSKDSAQNKLKQYVHNRHEYFLMLFKNLGRIKQSVDNLRPLLQDLWEKFFQSEVKLVSKILGEGIEKSEFEEIDINVYADLFIASMNGLRKITIKEHDASTLLSEEEFELIEGRIKNFSDVFIKAIIK